MRRRDVPGCLYLVHIEARVGSGASHYLGWSSDVERREAEHRAGRGSALLRTANELGVPWRIVLVLEGKTRSEERSIKRRKNLAQLCPVCSESWRSKRNAQRKEQRRRRREEVHA